MLTFSWNKAKGNWTACDSRRFPVTAQLASQPEPNTPGSLACRVAQLHPGAKAATAESTPSSRTGPAPPRGDSRHPRHLAQTGGGAALGCTRDHPPQLLGLGHRSALHGGADARSRESTDRPRFSHQGFSCGIWGPDPGGVSLRVEKQPTLVLGFGPRPSCPAPQPARWEQPDHALIMLTSDPPLPPPTGRQTTEGPTQGQPSRPG